MSNDYRPITGLFKKYWTNEPLVNATIIIRLLTNSFTLEAGYPTTKTPGNANDPGRSFQTDENGNLPEGLELFCSASSVGGGTKYRVYEPDGAEWDFILDYGDGTPISMQTLRAGGMPAENPATIIALIEDQIASKSVRYDISQSLTDTQKNDVKTALDISDGDAESPLEIIANNANEIPLSIKSAVSQIERLFQILTSTNGDLVYVTKDGYVSVKRLLIDGSEQIYNPGDGRIIYNQSRVGQVQIQFGSNIVLNNNAGSNVVSINNNGDYDTSGDIKCGVLYLNDGTRKQVKIAAPVSGKKFLYLDE